MDPANKVTKTDREWQETLTADQFQVLRECGTEPPWSSPLNLEKRAGVFRCAGCGTALFPSDTKFESGSGWPSFFDALPGAVTTRADESHGMVRIEAVCAACGGHLGHVFPDGPKPSGQRYCMNGTALAFEPQTEKSDTQTEQS